MTTVAPRRRARLLVVALLLLSILGQTSPAAAFNPGQAAPVLARGLGMRAGLGFFGPVGLALGLGLTAWEAYQFFSSDDGISNVELAPPGEALYQYVYPVDASGTELWVAHTGPETAVVWGIIYPDEGYQFRVQLRYESDGSGGCPNGTYIDTDGEGTFGAVIGSPVVLNDIPVEVDGNGNTCVPMEIALSKHSDTFGFMGTDTFVLLQGDEILPPATTERETVTELDCIDATGTVTVVTESSAPAGATDYVYNAPAAGCPPGSVLLRIEIRTEPVDGSGGSHLVYEWDQDPDLFEIDPITEETPYHECLFYLPGGDPCEMHVYRRLTPTDPETEVERCDEFAGNCTEWWTHSQRDQLFECHWGPYVLPAAECRELAHYYNPGTRGQLTPNPQLDPPPEPQPEETTGTPQQPGEQTTTPGTSTTTLPDPTPSEEHGDTSCWSSLEIGWNPVSWVLEPIKCALTWAFVPSSETVTQLQTVPQLFDGKAPFTYFEAGSDWLDGFAAIGSSCIHLQVPIPDYGSYDVVDSCTPDPVSAQIMAWRPWLSAVVWGTFLVPVTWWAWRQYAPGSQGMA